MKQDDIIKRIINFLKEGIEDEKYFLMDIYKAEVYVKDRIKTLLSIRENA